MADTEDRMKVTRFEKGSRVPGWDDAADLRKQPAGVPDPATTPVPDELRAKIEDYITRYPDPRSAAIPALHAAQELHGWCSPTALEQVACVMGLTPGYLAAVAGFYDMFNTQQVGRKQVYVCTNISCSLLGGDELLAALKDELGDDPDVNVRGFECLGACDIGPMASIDGVYVGPVSDDEVHALAQQIRDDADPLPGKQLIKRPCQDPGARS